MRIRSQADGKTALSGPGMLNASLPYLRFSTLSSDHRFSRNRNCFAPHGHTPALTAGGQTQSWKPVGEARRQAPTHSNKAARLALERGKVKIYPDTIPGGSLPLVGGCTGRR